MSFQRVSNYGSQTPWVARIGIQNPEILSFCQVDEQKRTEANGPLIKLQQRLGGLQRTFDQLHDDVVVALKEFRDGEWVRTGKVPSITELLPLAEGFLQAAKVAISCTPEVITVFYGDQFDHRFDRIVRWAAGQFGDEDAFTENARRCELFVKKVLALRDAIEHPATAGEFFVTNFLIVEIDGKAELQGPGWGIKGQSHTDILSDMAAIIERIADVSEILVTELFFKLKGSLPVTIEHIPESEWNPKCPVRLRVVPC